MYTNTVTTMVSNTAYLYYNASPTGRVIRETKHETRKEALKAKRALIKEFELNQCGNTANFKAHIELTTNY